MKIIAAFCMLSIAICLTGGPVLAQDLTSPPPNILPPPPPPPPPPRMDIPRIPQMDQIPGQPRAAMPRRKSFSSRIRECLDEGAAMGLGPNERSEYSRICANSR